ncbi:MAG: hypothetical protein MK481_05825 [SAR324 cluster bacterium]|nr:hypothetical protein [SAR324 cluster bacterium]
MKKLNSLKLILFWNLFLAIILVLSACGDLVKESDTGACNNAIDSRNYDTALTVCTSRKDKASAYMGNAGYDIINLLDSSGTAVVKFTDNTTGNNLGKDDPAGAFILNILKKRPSDIEDLAERTVKITSSKKDLDNASALLQPYLAHDSSPLNKDEILLNTFAISFAMQLDQILRFDNGTTSKNTWPKIEGTTLTCPPVDTEDTAGSNLQAQDGHIWTKERAGMQCALFLNAYDNSVNKVDDLAILNKWIDNKTRGLLPEPFDSEVCDPIDSLTKYLTKLDANIKKFALSGDNTKAITDADNSTKEMMKEIGCPTTEAEE